LVGIFWTRIGTPTGKAISGTVEEIEEHVNSGKPAMLYFSNKPVVPDSIDQYQYAAVKKLKQEFQSKNLAFDFDSVGDFRNKFQRHLSMKFNEEEYRTSLPGEAGYATDNSKEITVSEEAKLLLKEAASSHSGQIMKVGYKGGFTIQANGKRLNSDKDARASAKWEAVMQELLDNDLISEHGGQGQIFSLTQKGYDFADKLKSET